jgi:DNA-directed RNA polymerase specialized sigma24 family protein
MTVGGRRVDIVLWVSTGRRWTLQEPRTMVEQKREHFPPTLNTWIGEQMAGGTMGRGEINRHIMEAYEEPLRIYFLGSSWRTLGEPEEIVNGFLADRLDREEFFAKWQASGKRLRHWLINALHFYLKEQWRKERRHDAARLDSGGDDDDTHGMAEPGTEDREVDRTWARALVATACRDAQASCRADGLDDHWQLFIRHHLDGLPYRDCAAEFEVDPKRCAVMARTAAGRFREALQERLRQDGVPDAEIDEELMQLQEAIS